MKGTFSRKRYTKGVPFLSKMVYKRVRGWTMLQTPSPPKPPTPPPPAPLYKILLSSSPMGGHYHQNTIKSNSTDKIQMV